MGLSSYVLIPLISLSVTLGITLRRVVPDLLWYAFITLMALKFGPDILEKMPRLRARPARAALGETDGSALANEAPLTPDRDDPAVLAEEP
ncbi:hypothetical protein Adu01nite_86560 [Paractinoplanes durhamensis]|uniref:Uncharacterized protein n=1 Tax=Paractinoplanes durhamensis TaxID=113563 RepID=A0ABQ3ZBW1_9ACTN|nr:hypothetical protein Adu01nite_86560 [Actinoplanes durhamensis]